MVDPSKDRNLFCQTLTFPESILALLTFNCILANFLNRHFVNAIDIYVSNLASISNNYNENAYWAYHIYFRIGELIMKIQAFF